MSDGWCGGELSIDRYLRRLGQLFMLRILKTVLSALTVKVEHAHNQGAVGPDKFENYTVGGSVATANALSYLQGSLSMSTPMRVR